MVTEQKASSRKKNRFDIFFYFLGALFICLAVGAYVKEANDGNAAIAPLEMSIPASTLLADRNDFLGNPKASYTLVEFGDYQCPPCQAIQLDVARAVSNSNNRLKVDFRHLPLTGIHPHAQQAAVLSEQARLQGKFWPVHDALYQMDLNSLDAKQAIKTDGLGINTSAKRRVAEEAVKRDIALAANLKVSSTPSFLLCTPQGKVLSVSSIESVKDLMK